MHVISLDIGQAKDFGVIALQEHVIEDYQNLDRATDHYVLRYIKRHNLGTRYRQLIAEVKRVYEQPALHNECKIVIDGGQVGRAVLEMFHEAGLWPIAITSTGGHSAGTDDIGYTVPKVELTAAFLSELDRGRWHQATSIPESVPASIREEYEKAAEQLKGELSKFTLKINKRTKHVGMEAATEADHDDMVMSICMGLWYLKKVSPSVEQLVAQNKLREKNKKYDEENYGLRYNS